jgi:hypothetical protein
VHKKPPAVAGGYVRKEDSSLIRVLCSLMQGTAVYRKALIISLLNRPGQYCKFYIKEEGSVIK